MDCYHGPRGSGKTLHVVKAIGDAFELMPDTLRVFSNTPLMLPKHSKTGQELIYHRYYDLDELVNLFQHCLVYGDEFLNYRTIILIDEASVIVNGRNWKDIPTEITAFMCQSRHINVDIWYTTQSVEMVEPNFRRLTDVYFKCEHIKLFRFFTTPWLKTTLQFLEGNRLINTQVCGYDFFVKKYYGTYKTRGLDSMIGLPRSMVSKGIAPPPPELIKFLQENYTPKQIS